MATSSSSNFVGPLFSSTAPPTAADLRRSPQTGDMYYDTEVRQFCIYDSTAGNWRCTAALSAIATTTSSSTSSTTTSTT